MVGGSPLSAEGTSFCEKTAIFPNEAWMAASGTHWLWARISAACCCEAVGRQGAPSWSSFQSLLF